MPKLSPNEITANDIADYLTSEDDFAFEVSMFKACIDAGLRAEHGGTYQDPVTKRDRQFDIRALARDGKLMVRFAIECKNLKLNFPLLVSRVPTMSSENFHEVIISGQREVNPLTTVYEKTDTVRMTGNYSMFMPETFVGKSTTQVGRNPNQDFVDGDKEVFEKWAQAVASACELVNEAAHDFELLNHDVAATVVLPILVVPDETLWVADYSKEGILLAPAKKTDRCLIYLRKEASNLPFVTEYWFSHLQVFTKFAFIGYLKKFGHGEDSWDTLFNDTQLNPAFELFPKKYG